ncbi:hypothetical protein GJ744_010525 [Endocarpon pusillum]|uniref:alpha-amylase n=1 Tax=Endocarpon pusillum TaxID=364733 RepID=A0A8H7E7C2_9EURO|nr:hypothetical protein GJ744_010525 [Endocarpon pusillum]
MGRFTVILAAAAFFGGLASAGPGAAEWASRSIYQVMIDRFARSDGSSEDCTDIDSYCGGTWTGLINKLDYIQGMGFTAVQISPVVENIKEDTGYGEAYHGYWVNNMYGINENFGTAGDLSHLSQELHDRHMYLMVDVVINNMAQAIKGSMPDQTIDYSQLQPFNDEKYYHKYCNITDYDNDEIAQRCWLGVTNVALPDLDTESQEVTDMIGTWITGLVANYSIDGLRIDAAKHVNNEYLPPFVKAAGVFTFGEIYSGVVDNVCKYQKDNLISGLPNFPVYFPLIKAFTAGDMKALSDMISDVNNGCTDTSVLGTFAENHDLPRFASLVPDLALAKNAIAFTILADGIPTMYQGQEQHMPGNYSPYNRAPLWSGSESGTPYDTSAPLYNLTATLNALRNHAISIDSRYVSNHSTELFLDPSTMATRKGPDGVQIVAVFSNQGEKGGEYELSVGPGAYETGTEVIEVFSCTKSNANEAGNVTALMGAGEPKAFFPTAQMKGSGLCGYSSDAEAATNTSSGAHPSAKNGAAIAADVRWGTALLGVMGALVFWLL